MKKGISLIELLIYMSLIIGLLMIMISFMLSAGEHQKQNIGQNEVTAEAEFIFDKIAYAISSATATTGTYPANTLILNTPSGEVRFSLTGDKIYYTAGAVTTELSSDQVAITPIDNLFSRYENGSAQTVLIKMNIQYKPSNFSRQFETTLMVSGGRP